MVGKASEQQRIEERSTKADSYMGRTTNFSQNINDLNNKYIK